MKKLRSILGIGLCLMMALSLCVGCGQSSTPLSDEAEKDMSAYLTDGAVKDTDIVMTVNGEDVAADAYLYWVVHYFSQLGAYYGDFTMDDDFNGQTIGEYVMEAARENAAYYENIRQQAESRGIELTEDQQDEVDTYVDALTEQVLLTNCTNKNYQEELYTISLYCDTLEEQLFGTGGEYELSDEELQEYIGDNQYVTIDYLYFDNISNDADTSTTAMEKAENAYNELSSVSSDEMDDKFRECAVDSGVNDINNTMLVSSESDVVGQAALEIQEGELKILETNSGVYVIYRKPLDNDYLRTLFSSDAFTKLTYQWQDETDIQATDSMDQIDINAVFDNYLALQDEINAVYGESDIVQTDTDTSAESSSEMATSSTDVTVSVITD